MLDINLIRAQPEEVKKGLESKNADPGLVNNFLELDEKWRLLTKKFDDLRGEQKKFGKENKEKAVEIKEELKKIETELNDLEKMRGEILRQMPNLPLSSVPVGKNEKDNQILREEGMKPVLKKFEDYLDIARRFDLIDIERAAKVSGSRFGYLKGAVALLEFALVDFAVKTVIKEGFVPIVPPALINEKSMRAMGYLERGQEEVYYIPEDNLYLVGTSEQSIGPMHQDEVFDESQMPKRYVAFSSCFRREAGSYGKDTKGILRVHQFDKVEMFSITKPEDSEKEHLFLLSLQEKLMQALELPYRVVNVCSGELGDPAAAKYDIETWLPGQNSGKGEYRETQSTSNTTDFQSRRLNVRYKDKDGKFRYVHFINGTAFAIGRMIIAIIENYQTENEGVRIPTALQGYLGVKAIT